MKRLLLLLLLAASIKLSAQQYLAGGMKEVIDRDLYLTGSNYSSYLDVYNFLKGIGQTKQTPTPEGYEPFYISSYHRHGSRWLGTAKQYQAPIDVLLKAESTDMLTETGVQLLSELKKVQSYSGKKHLGQLTDVGVAQHKAMAQRMVKNFPAIFDGKGEYFAQSSTTKRCVVSMNVECDVIQSATHATVIQVNGLPGMQDRIAGSYKNSQIDEMIRKGRELYDDDKDKLTPYKRICSQLFKDETFLTVKEKKDFVLAFYYVAKNMRSHKYSIDLWKYFTKTELEALWSIDNRMWYYLKGPAGGTGDICQLQGRKQLVDIIEAADSVVDRKDWHGTNLRFGHDLLLIPLACLMELGTCGKVIQQDKISTLDKYWRAQEISPMGGNIQLIFYRPKNGKGDVLVKALLCEREVSLPGKAVSGVYYRWSEIRKQWLKIIKS